MQALNRHPLDGGIILEDDDGSVSGEPGEDLQGAIDAGILYVCPINDGTCPNGKHRGGPFLHYCEGKTGEDHLAWLNGEGCWHR